MIDYFLAALGLAMLCAGWVLIQLWMAKSNPDKEDIALCCGACSDPCHKVHDEQVN